MRHRTLSAMSRPIILAMVLAGLVRAGDADTCMVRLPPLPLGPLVLLADGGMLAATLESMNESGLVVRSPLLERSGGRLDLPWASVRGYRSSLSVGPGTIRDPDERAGETAILRLANGDEVAVAGLSFDDGQFTARTVSDPPRPITIPLDRVRAIQWAAPTSPAVGRRFVALANGSRFAADVIPQAFDPADIVAESEVGEDCRLLAFCAPLEYEQGSGVGGRWGLARGTTLAGRWPAARGTTGFTGLGIHAPARLRYRLGRPVRRFESLVALDDSAGQGGSVVVRIMVIGPSGEPREVYTSPVLRGGDEPHSIRVDLGDADAFDIVIDEADVGSVLDRTIWLDPRVTFGGESR